jgi:hypothetical protein
VLDLSSPSSTLLHSRLTHHGHGVPGCQGHCEHLPSSARCPPRPRWTEHTAAAPWTRRPLAGHARVGQLVIPYPFFILVRVPGLTDT